MGMYAVINSSGIVVNKVLWDGTSEWKGPQNMTIVYCEDTNSCAIGGLYKNGIFILPTAQMQPREESVSEAEQMKTTLLTEATMVINSLQDAVDLEIASDDEQNLLTVWKKYRVMLIRVDVSLAPVISWPKKPSLKFTFNP